MTKNNMKISSVTRSKEEAKASYDKMSKWYDILAGSSEKKYTDAGLEKLNAQDGETILEIGFGTGHSNLSLARSVGNSGKVEGLDMSEGMYNITRSRLETAGLSDRVNLTCGDAVALPFEADHFDAIFISFTLELFDTPEIPMVLHECHRVLKQGGRIAVVALAKKEKIAVSLYEWFHKLMPTTVDCRPIFVRRSLENAGFHLLDLSEISMWGLPVEVVVAEKGSGS